MIPKVKNRITFDYDNDRRGSYEKLKQIICSSYWGSGIDILGFMNETHPLLLNLMMKGIIVIKECEYEVSDFCVDNETAQRMKAMLGKRSNYPVLRDITMLFTDELFEAVGRYRNTIYFPNLKAFVRADGIKPEDISEMLSIDGCEKIILFPEFPLDGKSAYYELSLAVAKVEFVDFLWRVDKHRVEKMNEEINQADSKNFPAFKALLRYDSALDDAHNRLICDEVYFTLNKEESNKFNKKLAKPMDVEEYINLQPKHLQQDLRTVRLMLRMTLQIYGATEKISWGMPTYWKGQNLIHFAAHKNHFGIYPGAAAIEHFKLQLSNYKTSKGAIQIPYKDLINEHLILIREIAVWCAEHNAKLIED